MNIAVLAGGLSPERNVSITSGKMIASALAASGHNAVLADVYEGIEKWNTGFFDGFVSLLKENENKGISSEIPDLDAIKERNGGRESLIGPGIIDICLAADVVFIALHGGMGENGQLQALLDINGIRYTGSGYVGSALAMDKDLAKRIVRAAGVPTPDWYYGIADEDAADKIIKSIGLPCVVKPCNCGSSVGVSFADNEQELASALADAGRYGEVLAERKIIGREFSIGIIEGRVLPPIEIIPKSGFYDYQNKYQSGMTDEICPADLTEDETKRISELAMCAFEALRLEGYARIDFLMDENGFAFLEANTLPGMTPMSLIPQEAAAAGIDYNRLCCMIAESAFLKK